MTDAPPQQMAVQHVKAPDYRVVLADHALISRLVDELGTTIYITLTHLDPTPDIESIPVRTLDASAIAQVGPSTFTSSSIRRMQEVTAVMRPDHALQLARAILDQLRTLDDNHRARYRIPSLETGEAGQ